MDTLKSYFVPAQESGQGKRGNDGVQQYQLPERTGMSRHAPPAHLDTSYSTPMSNLNGPPSPGGSFARRNSFRNSAMSMASESLTDIKATVATSWLYEQQLSLQWLTAFDADEGVVIKKGRDNFTCCPPALAQVPGGFFEMAVRLNVRVR
jgi:hypothetical protein